MTIPSERTRAVLETRKFLLALADRSIKRIPKEVREQARSLLRHYPGSFDLDMAANGMAEVFAETGDRE